NKTLQNHWLLRIAAYLVDFVIIYTPFWVVSMLLTVPHWKWTSTLVAGVVMMLYSSMMEASSGETIGKRLVSLKTVSVMGPLDNQKTVVRNLSKVFPILVLLDCLIGLATTGDPRQRYTDRVAGTTVVETANLKQIPPTPSPYDRPNGSQSPFSSSDDSSTSEPSYDNDEGWKKV
ncbi:MAG: RDD family protein, partial [Thermoplasmata archaeon]|nr:RDD family protein [Thermoplasmata archaeon]